MSKIGIIGAMELEVATLKKNMNTDQITKKAGMEFHEGNLNGMPVVVVQCGVGKVNAAMCVQILADLYDVTYYQYRCSRFFESCIGYRRYFSIKGCYSA